MVNKIPTIFLQDEVLELGTVKDKVTTKKNLVDFPVCLPCFFIGELKLGWMPIRLSNCHILLQPCPKSTTFVLLIVEEDHVPMNILPLFG